MRHAAIASTGVYVPEIEVTNDELRGRFVDAPDFVDEMEAAGVDYQLIMYAGAVHAFTQTSAGDDPAKGVAYHADADRRSWQHMQVFLAEVFE